MIGRWPHLESKLQWTEDAVRAAAYEVESEVVEPGEGRGSCAGLQTCVDERRAVFSVLFPFGFCCSLFPLFSVFSVHFWKCYHRLFRFIIKFGFL